MTDEKSQGKQFSEVFLNLEGVYGSGTATRLSFMSLYVQLSRVERWKRPVTLSKTRERCLYRAQDRAG